MRKLLQKMAGLAVAVAMLFAPIMATAGPVWATEELDEGGGLDAELSDKTQEESPDETPGDKNNPPETTILPNDLDVMKILKLVLNILVYGLGVAAVLGTVIAAIMYLTARDNEQQVAKAKTRLYEVVIGLVAWAVMWALLQWLLPGGLNLS